MKVSIRQFLLINLLVAIAIVTSLTAIGTYYFDQKDIEHHLDEILMENALSFQALFADPSQIRNFSPLQSKLNKKPQDFEQLSATTHQPNKSTLLQKYLNLSTNSKYEFQVWSAQQKLLLASAHAPNQPFMPIKKTEFSDALIDNVSWRIFSHYEPSTGITVTVATSYGTRDSLAHSIAINDAYIILLSFPIIAVVLWVILGWGLQGLNYLAQSLAERDPNNLMNLSYQRIPLEVLPVVDEINKLFKRLQQAMEREQRFAADAAHELRTPLAALKTQAQVAKQATNDADRQIALQNVITGVNRSNHIVQQLLTLSRLVPGATHLEDTVPINVCKIAADIIAQLVPSALEKNIELALESSQSAVYIPANLTAINLLLRNLIDNAIRYSHPGGTVTVNVTSKKNSVILKVTDNGPGIPQELHARVFERFFRVLGNQSSGSGLGLAIVQQIAKLHNATVSLGSPPSGVGLEVTIIFPSNL
ncbi:MAG: ATP-binding protein [Gammaproteobacteria bacterium]